MGRAFWLFGFYLISVSVVFSSEVSDRTQVVEALENARQELSAGRYGRVLQWLDKVDDSFVSEDRWEVRRLRAEVALQQGQYRQAISHLSNWQGRRELRPLMRYNLALAYLHSGQVNEGLQRLNSLGESRFEAIRGQSIVDRANLTLGLHYYNLQQYSLAGRYIDRVKVDGEVAEQALLAAGWNAYQQAAYQDALTPLLVLQSRDSESAEAMEGLLLLGDVLARQGNLSGAIEQFESALARMDKQSRRLQRLASGTMHQLIQRQLSKPSHLLESLSLDWLQLAELKRLSEQDTPETEEKRSSPDALVNASLSIDKVRSIALEQRIEQEIQRAFSARQQQLARFQQQAQFRAALWYDQMVARNREAQ